MSKPLPIELPDGFHSKDLRVFESTGRAFTVHDVVRAATDVLSRDPSLTLEQRTRVLMDGMRVHRLAIVPTGFAPTIEIAPIFGERRMVRPVGFHGDERLMAVALYVHKNDPTEARMSQRDMDRFCLDFSEVLGRMIGRNAH
jgi:hypothetical protein